MQMAVSFVADTRRFSPICCVVASDCAVFETI